jgi:hypothetical protein
MDGALGTLPAGVPYYLDLREAPDGTIYGVFNPGGTPYPGGPCGERCAIHRIDPTTGTVTASTEIAWDARRFAHIRPDVNGMGAAVFARDSVYDEDQTFDVHYVEW